MDTTYAGYQLRLSRVEGEAFCLEVVGMDAKQVGHIHRMLDCAEQKQAAGAGLLIVHNVSSRPPHKRPLGEVAGGMLAKIDSNLFCWTTPNEEEIQMNNLNLLLSTVELDGTGLMLSGFSRGGRN